MDYKKIAETRKLLGVKQEHVAGKLLSRNQLSYLENGKTRLTKRTAKIIHYNIHMCAWLLDKRVDFEFDDLLGDDPDYLDFRDAYELNAKLSNCPFGSIQPHELNAYFENFAYSNIGFIKIPLMLLLWKHLSYYDSTLASTEILEKGIYEYRNLEFPGFSKPYLKIRPFVNKLVSTHFSNLEYRKMIDLIHFWKSELEFFGERVPFTIYFNLALAYSNISSYDLAQKSIDSYITSESATKEELAKAFIVKGNIYVREKKYYESIGWFHKAITSSRKSCMNTYTLALSGSINAMSYLSTDTLLPSFIEHYSELMRIDCSSLSNKATSSLLFTKAKGYRHYSSECNIKIETELYIAALDYSSRNYLSAFWNISEYIVDNTIYKDLILHCLELQLQMGSTKVYDLNRAIALLIKTGKRISELDNSAQLNRIFIALDSLQEARHEKNTVKKHINTLNNPAGSGFNSIC